MMLIIANMVLITGKELYYGTILTIGNPDHYVKKTAVKLLKINILKQHNGCHPVVRKVGVKSM